MSFPFTRLRARAYTSFPCRTAPADSVSNGLSRNTPPTSAAACPTKTRFVFSTEHPFRRIRVCSFAEGTKNPTAKTAVGDKVLDSAVPPRIDTASLPHPLIDCQHSQASYASFTSSATRCLSPRPSGAHIIGFGSCRHHTAADSLLVRHPFSSRQRFVKLP